MLPESLASSLSTKHYKLQVSMLTCVKCQSVVIYNINPFRLSFSEPKCARGGHIIFMESIFQHSLHEIVIYSINRKSYNKKVNIL